MNLKNLKNYLNECTSDGVPSGMSNTSILELVEKLEAAQKQVEQYRVYDDVIAEIDRRADKEWCLGDQCDFTVTITYEQYLAINAAQSTN